MGGDGAIEPSVVSVGVGVGWGGVGWRWVGWVGRGGVSAASGLGPDSKGFRAWIPRLVD